jgi:hypothetical protein
MKKWERNRRADALARLEVQLELGTKPEKKRHGKTLPLTDFDKKRIGKEIQNLKNKL